ncbi:thiol-disulfide oxidoreductase DCC family protein [Sessilibacter corallicola]|uniref:DUF393 domain-containing protein n=1 Tax=Sessilibacter corallicola TaxID=2904075 RepID=A0ABQ0AEM5_9GAMM|nr:DUF393 domain-containing protein [Sessilibacter corallicola]
MKPSLYFDGNCPLCSKEINWLKKRCGQNIEFVDVHTLSDNELDKESLLKVLHLRNADGVWVKGLDATVAIWSYTPYGFLFKLLRVWPVSKIADWLYEKWAARRYEKRYVCQQCKI